MASITLQVGAEYVAGTTVSVYHSVPGSVPGNPIGTAVTTGTVGTDGNVTFTGLNNGIHYLAYAASGHPQYVQFFVPGSNSPDFAGLLDVDPSALVDGNVLYWDATLGRVAGATPVDPPV